MTRLARTAATAVNRARTLVEALPARLQPLGLLAVALVVTACKGGGSSY